MAGGDANAGTGGGEGFRFLLRTIDVPPTEVALSVGEDRDCVLESETGPVVRFFERDGRLYMEPLPGNQPVRRNGREAAGPVALRDLDRIDCGVESFEVIFRPPEKGKRHPTADASRHSDDANRSVGTTPGRIWIPWVLLLGIVLIYVIWGSSRRPQTDSLPRTISRTMPTPPLAPAAPATNTVAAPPTPVERHPSPTPSPSLVPASIFRANDVELTLMPLGGPVAASEWWVRVEAEVGALALAPTGSPLAVACGDGNVLLLDPVDGRTLRVLKAHEDSVAAIAWVAGTTYLVTAGYDGRVLLWDAATGWLLRTLSEGPGAVRAVAVSPDGTTVVGGYASGALVAWDLRTGRELKWWSAHNGMVNALAFAPDGGLLASASADRTVRTWNTRDWRRERELRPHVTGVNAIVFADPWHVITGADVFDAGPDGLPRAMERPTAAITPTTGEGTAAVLLQVYEWVLAAAVVPGADVLLLGIGSPPGGAGAAPPGRLVGLDSVDGSVSFEFHLAGQGVAGLAAGPDREVYFAGLDGWIRRVNLPGLPSH